MDQPNALIIFAKVAIPGKTKTRLAQGIGNDEAMRIYNLLVRYTQIITSKVKAKRYIFYTPHIQKNDGWVDSLFTKKMQSEGNLGNRMKSAFDQIFRHHEKAVIIGTDCGELTSLDMEEAFVKLDDSDVVFGPANDGGYYLLGMKKVIPELFDDMPWSEDHLLSESTSICQKIDISYQLLEEKIDVDYVEDWLKVKENVEKIDQT